MDAKVIAITTTEEESIKKTTTEMLELQGGHSANICYTQRDWEEIVTEDLAKTENRIKGNKENNHHSVFGHGSISLYFTNIPKLLAMVLNNEHEYNTSEKSARYTKMKPTEQELFLYGKWIAIFEMKIKEKYPNEQYLTDQRIHKLAMENARYLISVMTPTKMEYTTSFRQLNYLYDFTEKMLNEPNGNKLVEMLKPSLEEFKDTLDKTGFITHDIIDYRNRKFSLITDDNNYEEMWGRCYSTNYLATFAEVAQQQRHRTLDYNISLRKENCFFIPPIIENDKELVSEWLDDMYSLENLMPQGTLVQVNETGKYEDFILKLQERLCTSAQLETCMQNYQTLLKYTKALRASKQPRDKQILSELEKYEKGARCQSGYHCPQPCGFKDGITLERKI